MGATEEVLIGFYIRLRIDRSEEVNVIKSGHPGIVGFEAAKIGAGNIGCRGVQARDGGELVRCGLFLVNVFLFDKSWKLSEGAHCVQ